MQGLMKLKSIPHSDCFAVSQNLQTDALTGDAVEVIVYAEFRDETQLAAYKAHAIYQEAIDIVRPLRKLRMAADFIA